MGIPGDDSRREVGAGSSGSGGGSGSSESIDSCARSLKSKWPS